MYKFNFEKLEVWNNARKLAKKIYLKTEKFPKNEKFGISIQLRRAIVSVCSNLAEGSSRFSSKEQMHFYSISYSSLMETINQLILSQDLGYLSSNDLLDFRQEVNSIAYMINALREAVKVKGS
ncbi:MAG: four helix bundle protein [Bacteroidota bacterium]|nr:four helix bundle protein [Bacteroidota bacterium]